MADGMSVSVRGLREVDERLAKVGAVAGEKIMRSTLFTAMKPVQEAVKVNAQAIQFSGALAASIRRVYVKRGTDIGSFARGAGLIASGLGGQTANRFVVSVAAKIKNRPAIALANLVYRRKKPIRGIFWSHLVEWGFSHKRSGKQIAGRHIFTRAFNSTRDAAVEIFRRTIGRKAERAARGQTVQ